MIADAQGHNFTNPDTLKNNTCYHLNLYVPTVLCMKKGAKIHACDHLTVALCESKFSPYVRGVWFFVQLRNCVHGTQFHLCTKKTTLSTKRRDFALGPYKLILCALPSFDLFR